MNACAQRLSEPRLVRLLVGVIAGTHERAAGGVSEAHRVCGVLEPLELRGLDIAQDRKMVRRRLQVLADSQHVDVVRAKIAHDRENLLVALPKSDHESGFGRNASMPCLERLQQLQ